MKDKKKVSFKLRKNDLRLKYYRNHFSDHPIIHYLHKNKLILSLNVELYTQTLKKIKKCSVYAKQNGIKVHAGHGLDYKTTKILSKINEIEEFNIGHFLIGESIFYGLKKVIKNFKKIIK